MKKKHFILIYLLTIFAGFVLIYSWEFWLEEMIEPFFFLNPMSETVSQKWEFVYTVVFYCAIAPIFPLLLANRIEKKHRKATDELKNHQLELEKKSSLKNTLNQPPDELKVARISLQSIIDEISETEIS